jgi:hypothetical protein
MTLSHSVTLTACGTFFMTGLLCGIWKWRAMVTSERHQAPFYVDTAHRAALLYSFACLVLREFLELSPFSEPVNTVAVAAPILFFGIAIATYIVLGLRDDTDNQFARPTAVQHTGMLMLIAAEVGGFGVLFIGFLMR